MSGGSGKLGISDDGQPRDASQVWILTLCLTAKSFIMSIIKRFMSKQNAVIFRMTYKTADTYAALPASLSSTSTCTATLSLTHTTDWCDSHPALSFSVISTRPWLCSQQLTEFINTDFSMKLSDTTAHYKYVRWVDRAPFILDFSYSSQSFLMWKIHLNQKIFWRWCFEPEMNFSMFL